MDIFEILNSLGIAVPDEKKTEVDTALRKSYKHKNEVEVIEGQLTQAKNDLAAAKIDIEKFKAIDVDGMKKETEEWKTKAFNYALDSALKGAKPKDTAMKAITALLDRASLELEDGGEIKGLREQIENIKKETPYLFQDEPSAQQSSSTTVDFSKPNPGSTPVQGDSNTIMNNLFRGKGETE